MPKVRCPECSSTNTVRIVYGLPDEKSKYEEDIKNGKIFWAGEAGCCIPRDDPNRHCNDCEIDFDTLAHKQKKNSYLQFFE